MESNASVKVPDGKMVEVSVRFGDQFEKVSITGDFFLQPPEALEEFENRIEGVNASASREELVERLEDVEAETIGFSREDLADALKEAVER